MGKGLDTGRSFLQGVLSKITDPELKTAAEKAFGSDLILTEIGNGVEGQSEIDRQLRAVADQKAALDLQQSDADTLHAQQVDWWTKNQSALEEYKTMKATGGGGGGGKKPDPPPADALTTTQFQEAIANERAAFLGYSRDQQKITREHFAKFQEVVDLDPLLHDPDIAKLGLIGVYEKLHKPRLEEWATKQKATAEEAIRADERQKIQAANANLPYPLPTGVGSGSPLDALTGTGAKDSVVDAATAHYQRLQAERVSGTRP